jgi:hypothetical protein
MLDSSFWIELKNDNGACQNLSFLFSGDGSAPHHADQSTTLHLASMCWQASLFIPLAIKSVPKKR